MDIWAYETLATWYRAPKRALGVALGSADHHHFQNSRSQLPSKEFMMFRRVTILGASQPSQRLSEEFASQRGS